MRFLAIGECMAELAPTDKEGDYHLGFAGDTFNTAWYLAQCAPQLEVSFLSAVGDDAISAKMTAFMRDTGVGDQYVRTIPGRTVGLYLISLERGERSFSYWRGQSAARGLADSPKVLGDAMAMADVIYFSGITLAILPPESRATLLNALRDARAAGRTIAFDPNLRPKLWASTTEMTQEITRGAAVSDIVLPSFEDEARWFNDADPKDTAKRYQQTGANIVVVKNGSKPVYYCEDTVAGELSVTPVKNLVDTTAAGDSFNAGFFASYAIGGTLPNGVKFACALSRAVVQHRGALVPLDYSDLSLAAPTT